MKIKRGSTSVRRLIFVADSSSTTGAGLASLVYNTASLVAYYFAGDLSNEVQITLATATLGTFASGGFVAVDNTNMPGWYEIGIPDAALDGGNECAIQFRGAANMVPVNIYIELDAFDYQTATQPVNATQFAGQTITAAAGVTIPSAIASPTNITAGTITTVTTLTGHTPQTGDSFARIGALGAGLTSLAPAATALSTATWTATIAGRIDVAVSTRLAPLVAGRDIAVAATSGAVELDSAATAALVDLIWDEPLTGATHNVATSSGKRLRQTTAFQQIDSTVIDAAATTTTFITGLTSSVDNFYNDSMLVFTDGALAGQVRAIYDYIGATKTIVLEEALTSAPVNGVAFTIVSLHIHPVSQIQSGLATSAALATVQSDTNDIQATLAAGVELDSATQTQITAIETFATRVTTGIVQDGAAWQFTANMLELGPSGGGGSSVNVLPATGIVSDRSAGTTLLPVVGETISQSITVYQSDGTTAVSLSGKTLKVIFETMSGVDVAVVLAADITISGASSNVVTFAYPSAVTASERTLRFAIRDAAAPLTMYLQGVCSVVAAPKVDA
jgi:hypothetical protein